MRKFATDERAAVPVEYALLGAFMLGGIILDAEALKTAVEDAVGASSKCIDVAAAGGC